jgi:hypothetical protein
VDRGGPGCTPLFGIGALLERTKAASDADPGTKSEPGMSDAGSLRWGLSSATSLWIRTAGAWIENALRWRGPDNANVQSSVFRPSSSAVVRAVRSIGDEVRDAGAAGAMRG